MKNIFINNATIVNEGELLLGSIFISDDKIERVLNEQQARFFAQNLPANTEFIDATGLHLLPGLIDDQVHFREPGLTHKGNINSESRAAVAGGITSFMEMPNTVPNALTQDLLEEKYQIAERSSLANFSFFMGVSNNNAEEVLKTNPKNVCGIKIFLGSSTGNMLVDKRETLEKIFSESKLLIAVHCEDEQIIRENLQKAESIYGANIPIEQHPIIRNAEACYKSSSMAVELAKKYNTRLHILHISTAIETNLFESKPLEEKRITAEACIHHLWFNEKDYKERGNFIRWNPAIKSEADREAIWKALLDNRIDVIATDHAPHTIAEKNNPYLNCPSGGPLVQHALVAMLEFYHQQKITLPFLVEKMCHAPAKLFEIEKRGFLKPGYYADMVLVDLNHPWKVEKSNILAHCGWSPFEGITFQSKVTHTIVNGNIAYQNDKINEEVRGMRLRFNR